MSKIGKYLSATKEEPPPPQKRPTDCLVNGCPLPGVYRQTNETSVCCVHDEEDPKDWAEQTVRIKNRLRLFHAAFDMTNMPPAEAVKEATVDKLVSLGAPPPKYRDGERMTLRLYGAQLRGWLVRECKGEKQAPPIKIKQGWRGLADVLGVE